MENKLLQQSDQPTNPANTAPAISRRTVRIYLQRLDLHEKGEYFIGGEKPLIDGSIEGFGTSTMAWLQHSAP